MTPTWAIVPTRNYNESPPSRKGQVISPPTRIWEVRENVVELTLTRARGFERPTAPPLHGRINALQLDDETTSTGQMLAGSHRVSRQTLCNIQFHDVIISRTFFFWLSWMYCPGYSYRKYQLVLRGANTIKSVRSTM